MRNFRSARWLSIAAGLALCARVAKPILSQESDGDKGIHKIKHVIVIMQENRSFDHYFGTFPSMA